MITTTLFLLEKNTIFPKAVKELRLKNGFWLSEEFENEKKCEDGQMTLDEIINSEEK